MNRVHLTFGLSVAMALLCCAVPIHAQQAVVAVTNTSSNAIVPSLLNLSGVFTDAGGKPLTIMVGVTFSLYQEQQGGAPLWLETQNVQPDSTGHYSVMLGAATSAGVPSSLFANGEAHWLGVQVQGQKEQPRVLLVSAPYALKAGDAQTVGGLPSSAFLLAAPIPSSASTPPPSAASGPLSVSAESTVKRPISGSGTTNYIPIWTSSTALGNSNIYQAHGADVGINTTTPGYTLDVNGAINTTLGAYRVGACSVLSIAAVNGGDPTSTAVGCGALASDTNTAGSDTAVGSGALFNNTAGSNNTASGYQALYSNTTGNRNTATGSGALFSNTTASDNTAIGVAALRNNTTASDNTADGYQAIYSNTTGNNNTASGYQALYSNTTGSDNTASGSGALFSNTTAGANTAAGYQSLYSNTTGTNNLADGSAALYGNTTGNGNTAGGSQALYSNTTASGNTAEGVQSLYSNTTGSDNTGSGFQALNSNITGSNNTASGYQTLYSNTTASDNTASGYQALYGNTTGNGNTAGGFQALISNTSGSNNIAIGYNAASTVAGENSNNIHIGSVGASGDNGTVRIGTNGTQTSFFVAGVRGVTTGDNNAVAVMIDSNGQLGTISSSRRFKEDIRNMGDASESLMRLRPVTFRYKQPFDDGSRPIQYGLIAEEVAEVYPNLVAHSPDGRIETVKYQVLGPMLLNEVQRHDTEIRDIQDRVNKSGAQRRQDEIRNLQQRLDKIEAEVANMAPAPQTP
jgi:hypothetical protein